MIQYDETAAKTKFDKEFDEGVQKVLGAMEGVGRTLDIMDAVDRVLNEAVAVIDDMYIPFSGDAARERWKNEMKRRAGLIKPEPPKEATNAVRPIPCKSIDGKPTHHMTVKTLIAKIDEECNEFKREVYAAFRDDAIASSGHCLNYEASCHIAEEAADTITAITTMLEAMGITEDMRDKAQEAVNERNKARGRL